MAIQQYCWAKLIVVFTGHALCFASATKTCFASARRVKVEPQWWPWPGGGTSWCKSESDLLAAVNAGRSDAVSACIEAGVSANTADPSSGWSALFIAASKGELAVVKLLVNAGAAKQATTAKGFSPLHVAAQNGHRYVVKLLLNEGGAKEATTLKGYRPLHLAAQNGKQAVVKLMVEAGADKELLKVAMDFFERDTSQISAFSSLISFMHVYTSREVIACIVLPHFCFTHSYFKVSSTCITEHNPPSGQVGRIIQD